MPKLKWKKDQSDWWLSEAGIEEIAIEKIDGKWAIVGWYKLKKSKILKTKLDTFYPSVDIAKNVVEDILNSLLTKIVAKLNAKSETPHKKLTKKPTKSGKKTKRTKTKSGKKNE